MQTSDGEADSQPPAAGGRAGAEAPRACALAAGRIAGRGPAPSSPSYLLRPLGPVTPGPESERVTYPRRRLRTSVPGTRAAGLLEVERGEGARQETAAVTARAWSRGRWSTPPPPPALFSFRSGLARQVPRAPGRLRERETEREREKEEGRRRRRRIQGIGAGEPICATGKTK